MGANDARRFIVKLEVYAAAGHMELDAAAARDVSGALADVVRSLAMADPDEIEDETYRAFRFDVCDECRKTILRRPLPTL
jgi:hypothetical protein